MAILGTSTLTGCDSIPNFIATGSRMVFEQTAAPTSWTKETDAAFNNVALQAIIGTVTNGGGSPFTSIFPTVAKGVGAVPLVGPANLTVNASGAILAVQQAAPGIVFQGKILTANETRTHGHVYTPRGNPALTRGTAATQNVPDDTFEAAANPTGNAGSSQPHTHGFNNPQHGPGHHSIQPGSHAHTVNDANHTHSFTMTSRVFDVNYMDVIICIKS
jgi:hypothetical protein